MKKDILFVIRHGKYVIPNFGNVDTRKKYTNDQYLDLYLNEKFPFISITEKAVKFLKKKLTKKQVATLINKSNSIEEIEILLQVHADKTIKEIASFRLDKLK